MALSIDGSASAAASSVTLSTTKSADIIVLYSVNVSSVSITSISGGGLTWNSRASFNSGGQSVDLWWAYSAAIQTSMVITPTYSGACSPRLIAISVNGANTTTPWDVNVSFPAETGSATAQTLSVTISTNAANTMLLAFLRSANALSTVTRPTNFNSIVSGGANSDDSNNILSSTISSVLETFSWTGTAGGCALIIDAIQAAVPYRCWMNQGEG